MKHGNLIVSLVFAIIIWWFWTYPHVSVLSYQEQYQLFLFNGDYFIERIKLPGGLADYIAEFLVQLYYVPLYGAVILALLFFLIQRLVWVLCRMLGAAGCWFPLSFCPVLALWFMMADENVLLSFHVSLLSTLSLCWMYEVFCRSKGILGRTTFLMVSLVAGYWLWGPTIYVLMVWAAILEMRYNRTLQGVFFIASMLIVLLVVIILSSYLPYEFHRFFVGLNYYRYPVYDPSMQFLVMTLFAFVPWGTSLLPKDNVGRQTFVVATIAAIGIGGLGGTLIYGVFNDYKFRLIEYDYLVRTEQWDKIIATAEREAPIRPMDVSCVNLALSQKGVLADRLFDFYQRGTEGLFPSFTRDMTSPVSTAEIFFRLGMVNDAHRYMFEAQEAIPNYRKSGRMTKRIIQCEIVNGQYDVAKKFLRILSQSLFYRKWAESTAQLIDNEVAVERDALYGRLREVRYNAADYLFSDSEMDQMLGMLFTSNVKNRMAYEYLMCHVLLQRNVEKFMQYYPLTQYVGYKRIPKTFQEILIGDWLQKHTDPKTIPYKVDNNVLNNTINFIQIYTTDQTSTSLDHPPYSTNAWHYILRGYTGSGDKLPNKREIY